MKIIHLIAVVVSLAYGNTTLVKPISKGLSSGRQYGQRTKNGKLTECEASNASQRVVLSRKAMQMSENDLEKNPRVKRHVIIDNVMNITIWKDGVFYTFNTSDQTVINLFQTAVMVWSDNTCIDFIEDTSARDKVVVIKGDECWSATGRHGGDQHLSLNDDCMTEASAMHEIGHALGLLHTVQRYDRDNFIKVVFENLDPLCTNDFEKLDRNYTDVYGLSYDYGSVMHYGDLSGSINNKPTLIALNSHYQKTMGSPMIAFSDIFIINEHYGCNAKCNKFTSAKCVNEGFPHPRNCSICICPGGYGGNLCDQRPQGCGEDLEATSYKQLVIDRVGRGMGLRDHFDFCYYMIVAPEGKKIEVDHLSISQGYENSGCVTGGVEIKAQMDQKMTGYRFCSTNGSNGPVVSVSNRLPVILYNKLDSMQATFIKYEEQRKSKNTCY